MSKVAAYSLAGLFLYTVVSEIFGTLSVTGLNIVLGIITMLIGGVLAITGVMANDSGKGGLFVLTLQFLSISYPLIYLIGLVSSILMLYSDFENKELIAFWLASIAGIQLLVIVILFGTGYLYEERQRIKRWEKNHNKL